MQAQVILLLLAMMQARSAGADPDLTARVPMRDGVRLETLIYLPENPPEAGSATVLLRTPYLFPGAAEEYYEHFARVFTGRGYAFVLQNVRGRIGSGGTFRPFAGEIADGADTADWIAAEPWSNGRIGTVGGSYNGFTALATAIGSDRVGAVVADDPAIDLFSGRRGGAVSLLPVLWLYLLDNGEWPNFGLLEAASNAPDPEAIDNLLLGRDSAFWQDYLDRSSAPADRTLRGRLAEICAPVLVAKSRSEAWEDPVEVWRTLRHEGCPRHRAAQRLIVTAEGHTHHMDLVGVSETPVNRRMLDWFDRWLRDSGDADGGLEEAPVLYQLDRSGPFFEAETWPVPGRARSFYLQNPWSVADNAPLRDRPATRVRIDELEINPAAMSPCSDYPRQTYLSDPLESAINVAGSMRLEVFVSASTPSMEISALVYDFDHDREREERLDFVTFAVGRVEPTEGAATRAILEMPSLGHRFGAGSRIALAISGSSCGYAEAKNSALRDDPPRASTYRIHHGVAHPSRLVLENTNAAD